MDHEERVGPSLSLLYLHRTVEDDPLQLPLEDRISRIADDPGFSNLSEEELELWTGIDDKTAQQEEDEDEDEQGVSSETVRANKADELIRLLLLAQNESSIALDFISLLLSASRPAAGSLSMSPLLKARVPVGALGIDGIRSDQSTTDNGSAVGRGWKMSTLRNVSRSLLSKADDIEQKAAQHVVYWQHVLQLKIQSWPLRGVKRQLAVDYGMVPTKRNYSILVRNGDEVEFAKDEVQNSRFLHVWVCNDADHVKAKGTLGWTTRTDEQDLSQVLRWRRDATFDAELHRELLKEVPRVLSEGVQVLTPKDEIVIPLASGDVIHVKLDTVDDNDDESQDDFCIGLIAFWRVLLAHAHQRQMESLKQPTAVLGASDMAPEGLHLIRPILAYYLHIKLFHELTFKLAPIVGSPYRTTTAELIFDTESSADLVDLTTSTLCSEFSVFRDDVLCWQLLLRTSTDSNIQHTTISNYSAASEAGDAIVHQWSGRSSAIYFESINVYVV